jgi:hypothetical protein
VLQLSGLNQLYYGKNYTLKRCHSFIRSNYKSINPKGSVLLGGGVGFSSTKVEDAANETQSKSVSISPAVGIAVQQNLIVGLNLRYASTRNKFNGTQTSNPRSTSYTAGFFVRKYLSFAKGFYFFAESGVYYSKNKSDIVDSPLPENKFWSTGINFYPGLAYKLTNKIHLEAGLPSFLNLEYSKSKYTDTNTPRIPDKIFGLVLMQLHFQTLL